MGKKRSGRHGFFHEHSLSLIAAGILALWIVLYCLSDPDTHLGSFFGNAIADWTGLLVTVLATKGLFEIGSAESKRPSRHFLSPVREFLEEHSLTVFLAATGVFWLALFLRLDAQGRWGQVVGNIVSEWTQIFGLVVLTKKFMEHGSKESNKES
jgi:hypothetical protein